MSVRVPCGVRLLAWFAAAFILLSSVPVTAKPTTVLVSALPHVARRIAHALPLRIVAFGSSSTEGVGASSPATTYPSRLQAFLRAALPVPVDVVNAGVGGEDADDMARRLSSVVAIHPDLVIWQTGSNDPLRGVPLARFERKTREGVNTFRAAGSDVMLMEQQDCDVLRAHPGSLAYRDALRRIAAEMQVPLVRRYDLMRSWLAQGLLTRAQLLYSDGLHMTDGGYAQLAIAVGEQILALLGRAGPQAAHAGK
jgi:acyl-CoA thioesterase-1